MKNDESNLKSFLNQFNDTPLDIVVHFYFLHFDDISSGLAVVDFDYFLYDSRKVKTNRM